MDSKIPTGAGTRQRPGKGKKQATPSQVRANHEKQQQTNGKPREAVNSKSIPAANGTRKVSEKQLNVKVKSLHEQTNKSLEAYSKKAEEIKGQISAALERQDKFHQIEQLNSVEELRDSILELTGAKEGKEEDEDEQINGKGEFNKGTGQLSEASSPAGSHIEDAQPPDNSTARQQLRDESRQDKVASAPTCCDIKKVEKATNEAIELDASENIAPDTNKLEPKSREQPTTDSKVAKVQEPSDDNVALSSNCFEPLTARLDPKTKYVALKSSLERHFVGAPHLLEPICKKLIHLTGQIDALSLYSEQSQLEIQKLTSIKDKLSDLCRELQKSNNQIRIESLDMIKLEQAKAKDQAGKIQSTLSGVMKLFDENQQRNLVLKQENIELQGKLKSLLEHCENWEKCVETTLKQREIENRLAKTELARMGLLRNEEKEKFFKEKSELIKALTTLKEHQNRIEDREAKLRSDLTSYASKYDECQEIIHTGLSKFQVESKRMLKQIEQGRRDYVQLLNKYEASNKKIKQLLEEKQSWAQSMSAANNKLEALERLCRALKAENDRLSKLTKQPGAEETMLEPTPGSSVPSRDTTSPEASVEN